jgi:hypothetical protein
MGPDRADLYSLWGSIDSLDGPIDSLNSPIDNLNSPIDRAHRSHSMEPCQALQAIWLRGPTYPRRVRLRLDTGLGS